MSAIIEENRSEAYDNETMAKRKETLPERLKRIRTEKKLTQSQAAAKLRVSLRTWASWESGEYDPPAPIMLLIDFLEEGKI